MGARWAPDMTSSPLRAAKSFSQYAAPYKFPTILTVLHRKSLWYAPRIPSRYEAVEASMPGRFAIPSV
jgi:hypothetical protein